MIRIVGAGKWVSEASLEAVTFWEIRKYAPAVRGVFAAVCGLEDNARYARKERLPLLRPLFALGV